MTDHGERCGGCRGAGLQDGRRCPECFGSGYEEEPPAPSAPRAGAAPRDERALKICRAVWPIFHPGAKYDGWSHWPNGRDLLDAVERVLSPAPAASLQDTGSDPSMAGMEHLRQLVPEYLCDALKIYPWLAQGEMADDHWRNRTTLENACHLIIELGLRTLAPAASGGGRNLHKEWMEQAARGVAEGLPVPTDIAMWLQTALATIQAIQRAASSGAPAASGEPLVGVSDAELEEMERYLTQILGRDSKCVATVKRIRAAAQRGAATRPN